MTTIFRPYRFLPVRCFAALAYMLCSVAAAQAPPTQTSQQTPAQSSPAQNPTVPAPDTPQAPTLSTTVNEVSLDFVAHDKKNIPVLDLKAEDLTVTDNGAVVKLNGLHLVRGESARGYVITFVFDRFTGETARAVQQVAGKVLKELPVKQSAVSVLDIGGRLRLIHGFTTRRGDVESAFAQVTESKAVISESRDMKTRIMVDPAEDTRVKIAAAEEKNLISIARTGANVDGAHVSMGDRALAESLLKALQDTHTIAHEQHAPVALAALLAIVKSQEKLTQRKALIYFTTNRQMDTAQKQFLKTIEAAASRSGVTIYTIDLDALDTGAQYQMESALGAQGASFNPGLITIGGGDGHSTVLVPTLQESPAGIQGTPSPGGPVWGTAQDVAVAGDFQRRSTDYAMFAAKSPMADLAVNTGGIYIDAQVKVTHPLDQMHEDMTTYYEATYTPPTKEYDGSFHSIVVKPVSNSVHVKYKTGYYALAPGADGSIRPFEAPLLKTLGEMKLPTDVDFHAAMLRFGDLTGGNTTTIAVEVPLSSLQTKQDTNTNLYSAHITVAGRIRDKAGVVVEHFGEDITKRGALEQMDRDHTGTIELHRYFLTTPGDYMLEVAVSDELSGKVGAQRVEFTIPPPATGASLSDMVLVRKMDQVRESDDDDPMEPLRYDKGKVTPNITGELPENAKGVSLFFIVHPETGVKGQAILQMEVSRNGKTGKPMSLPVRALDGEGSALPYLSSFGSALAPGDYIVKAFFTQGSKTAEQQIAFHVDGEVAGAAAAGTAGAAKVDVGLTVGDTGTHVPGSLAIGAATNPFPPLAPAEAQQLLQDARQAALDYHEGLPNFMCIEVTNRSVDPSASGRWKLQDNIVELLRYRDKTESRNTLEVDGRTSNLDREGMKGAVSTGEFGGVLRAIFGEKSKADFAWKETDQLSDQPVQVFTYKVARQNSTFSVTDLDNREVIVPFYGQVFVDATTRRVRRVTLIADDLPKAFTTRATSIAVDYDYVSINNHDYLLPISAEMRLVKNRGAVMNTMEFRDYKRFGSSMRIVDFSENGDTPAASGQTKPDAAKPTPETKPQ